MRRNVRIQSYFKQGFDCKIRRFTGTKFVASKTASFCNDCSPSPLCNGSAIKGRGASSVGNDGRRFFSSFKCLGYDHLGGGAAVTTEDCRWFYKSRAKATSRRGKKTEQDKGGQGQKQRDGEAGNERKNWERQRIETHKTETNTSSKPRKPVLIFSSSIVPLQAKKRRTQAANRDLHRHRNKRKTEGAGVHRRERNRRPTSFLATSRSR